MINILRFNVSNNYNYSWGLSSRAPYLLFDHLDELMIIYRYKLPQQFTKGGKYLNKFQCKNPNKLDFSKLKGKNLFLLHVDVWKEDTEKLKDLIDYCNDNEIDIWIDCFNQDNYNSRKDLTIYNINNILSEYDINEYDLTKYYSNEEEAVKTIIRDIKLNKLF